LVTNLTFSITKSMRHLLLLRNKRVWWQEVQRWNN